MEKIKNFITKLNITKEGFVARWLVIMLTNIPLIIIRFPGYEGFDFITKGIFQLLIKEPAMLAFWSYVLGLIPVVGTLSMLLEKVGMYLVELVKAVKTKLSK